MKSKAIYLDLQGTLGGEGLGDIRDFEFYPFAYDAIREINKSDYLAILITNQSNIGRGLLSFGEYESILNEQLQILKEKGGSFDLTFCCPHLRSDNCACKKPKPGMIMQSLESFDIDLSQSWIIGDMGNTDMILGDFLGMKKALVKTGCGKGSLTEYRNTWEGIEPDIISENVLDSTMEIINGKQL